MAVRLAFDVVVGRGRRVWAPADDRAPILTDGTDLAPGAPVVVGPSNASDSQVRDAIAELAALVATAGAPAAGAGVELTAGFRSARLDGARGDRRDAVLAALRTLGVEGSGRIGSRAGLLVTLFGSAGTKPVGVRTAEAIADGRWAALHLASAVSDVLGPEQLETVLRLDAPAGVDLIPHGAPSVLGQHLAQVLGPVPRDRRLRVLVDLWHQVCAHQTRVQRSNALRARYVREGRVDGLRRRYAHFQDDLLLAQVRADVGHEPSLIDAARWQPEPWQWSRQLFQLVADALAATALLRAAVAVADHGPTDGLAGCREELGAAATLLDAESVRRAARRVAGLPGVPARPGCYVRDIDRRIQPHLRLDAKTEAYVSQRLARAGDYGIVVAEFASSLLYDIAEAGTQQTDSALTYWAGHDLRDWRAAAGYTAARPPGTWEQPARYALTDGQPSHTLADRLRARPDAAPAEVEIIGDLLWYADLVDALARLHGHDAAQITYSAQIPDGDFDPAVPEPALLDPRTDSVPAAVAGAAQLVSLGGQPPRGCKSWKELVDALLTDAAIAEALTGVFRLPPPLAAVDGASVPGARVRFELARDPHRLAEWSAYMGNCIAGSYYIDEASAGRCGLAALRDPDGSVVANVELRPTAHGWHVEEFQARFNAEPDVDLVRHFKRWVATIPLPGLRAAPLHPARTRSARSTGRRPARPVVQEVGEPLVRLAEGALADLETVRAAQVLTAVARRLNHRVAAQAPDVALLTATALRRAAPARLVEACREVLRDGGDDAREAGPSAADLWVATAVRPMTMALAGLDPALRERFDQLGAGGSGTLVTVSLPSRNVTPTKSPSARPSSQPPSPER